MHDLHPLIEDWLAHLAETGKSERTTISYRRALALFVRWSEQSYGQPFDPPAIIPRDAVDWKSYQLTIEKARPSTINQRLTALSRFFKWAVARGAVRADPTADVSGVDSDPRHPKALDNAQLRRLLRAVNKGGTLRDMALFELMVGTGLRVSEVLALQREDVALNDRSGEVIVRAGKGGKQRSVPLTASVRRAVRAYLEDLPEMKPTDPLWQGQRGALTSPSGIFRLLKKYARQAGLAESLVSPHILRHTFASRYLAANPGDLRGLAAILGHSSLDTVMIYTEPTTQDLATRMELAETKTV